LYYDTTANEFKGYKSTGWASLGGTSPVSSVFGRTGAVTAASGDYSVGSITGAAPLASPTFTGTVTAPQFVGGGAGITGVTAANADTTDGYHLDHLYCDYDRDGHYATNFSVSCPVLSRTTVGDDCDDWCKTCYTGSTLYTTTPDGYDQNCNGTVDELTVSYGCVASGSSVNCDSTCTTAGYQFCVHRGYPDCNTYAYLCNVSNGTGFICKCGRNWYY